MAEIKKMGYCVNGECKGREIHGCYRFQYR
jgi:hypothetical protein